MATFTYNNVNLQVGSLKCRVSTEFVKDDSARIGIYSRNIIEASFVVQADAGTNLSLLEIRRLLATSGAPLIFEDKGFSSLSCNAPGKAFDIKAGPHPEIITWQPIGDSQACEVTWRCVVCLPPICGSGPLPTSGIMAINYDADFTITRGWTTRTLTGYIEVIVARLSPTQNLSDCADLYRDYARINVPPGFERDQKWHTDASKSRLNFIITDKQIESPNAYPPGFVKISASQDITWSANQRTILRQNFDMQCEQKPGSHKAAAYAMFLQMALQRINAAKNTGVERYPWLESVRISDDDLFGYRSSFAAQWRIIGCLDDIITPTGIWTPLDTNWNAWRASMADAFGVRGYAGLGLFANNDIVVNLCGSPGMPWPDQNLLFPTPPPLPRPPSLSNSKPPAKYSWIDYEMSVIPSREQALVRHAALQTPIQLNGQGSMDDTAGPTYEDNGNATPDVIQNSGTPRYSFMLIGKARRAGHPIPRPTLTSVGGVPVEEVAHSFEQKSSLSFGQPVYSAAWASRFMMARPPSAAVPPPQNKETDPCLKVPGSILQ